MAFLHLEESLIFDNKLNSKNKYLVESTCNAICVYIFTKEDRFLFWEFEIVKKASLQFSIVHWLRPAARAFLKFSYDPLHKKYRYSKFYYRLLFQSSVLCTTASIQRFIESTPFINHDLQFY